LERIFQFIKTTPRIVGETGGKDFVFAHTSANIKQLIVALVRGAFEYQGQKCSAASRAYIPKSIWKDTWDMMSKELSSLKMGDVEDFTNLINAVIDEKAFNNIAGYIDYAKKSNDAEIIYGGNYDKSTGYFIEPTVILAKNLTLKQWKKKSLDQCLRSMFMKIINLRKHWKYVIKHLLMHLQVQFLPKIDMQ